MCVQCELVCAAACLRTGPVLDSSVGSVADVSVCVSSKLHFSYASPLSVLEGECWAVEVTVVTTRMTGEVSLHTVVCWASKLYTSCCCKGTRAPVVGAALELTH
jgi:hypothetical protein